MVGTFAPARPVVLLVVALLVSPLAADAMAHSEAPHIAAPEGETLGAAETGSPSAPADPATVAKTVLDLLYRAPGHRVAEAGLMQAPAPTPLDTNHDARILFTCPSGLPPPPGPTDSQGDIVVHGCPIRVYDFRNALGSPDIAVNPNDPNQVAFFSLHGNVLQDGPTDNSRSGQSHTTFTSESQGLRWLDQPYNQQVPPIYGDLALGEFASGAMDSQGNLYISYLWSMTQGNDLSKSQGNLVGLFQADPVTHDRSVRDAYIWPTFMHMPPRELVRDVHVLGVPVPEDAIGPANGTNGTDTDDEPLGGNDGTFADGNATALSERMFALWHVEAQTSDAHPDGWAGWIDGAWIDAGTENWTRIEPDKRFGPCKETSPPVEWDGQIYIACNVAFGYDGRPRARVGDIDIWKIDPVTMNATYVGFTGLHTGDPILDIADDGYALIVTNAMEDGKFVGRMAFGWYGIYWVPAQANLGPYLHRLVGGGNTVQAQFTAVAMTEDEKVGFIIYQEYQNGTDPPTTYDPNNPPNPDDYVKAIVAVNECDFVTAAARLELGAGLQPYNFEAYQTNPAAFNDAQDGLLTFRDQVNDEEFVLFAANDYGSMQYGGIDVSEAASFCPVPPGPSAVLPATPIANPLTAGFGAQQAMGAGLGLVATAMVGYLLVAKRRVAQSLATEDK